jgi:hypothetical protein
MNTIAVATVGLENVVTSLEDLAAQSERSDAGLSMTARAEVRQDMETILQRFEIEIRRLAESEDSQDEGVGT